MVKPINIHVFQKLPRIAMVDCFDLSVIDEVLLDAPVAMDLEVGEVKSVILFPCSNITNGHIEKLGGTFICLRLVQICWNRFTAITTILLAVQ